MSHGDDSSRRGLALAVDDRSEVARLAEELEAAAARAEEMEFLAAAEEARLRADVERLLEVAAAAEARAQAAMVEVQDWRDRIVALAEDEASAHEIAAAVAEERDRAYEVAAYAERRADEAEMRAEDAEGRCISAELRAEDAEARTRELRLALAEAEARAAELEVPAARELELEREVTRMERERDVAIAELLAVKQEAEVWRARALASNPTSVPAPLPPPPPSYPPEEPISSEARRVLFETGVEAVMFGRTREGLEILRKLIAADPDNEECRSWILQAEAFLESEGGAPANAQLASQSQWQGS